METIGAQYILKFSAAGSCAKDAKICSAPYFLVLQYISYFHMLKMKKNIPWHAVTRDNSQHADTAYSV